MLPISRILMPVDFSQRCLGMIPHVKQFARQYNAEILLLHVVNPVYVIPETGISSPAILSVPEWILTTQTRKMEEFAASELRDFRVRRLVYEGDPEAQIVATAEAEAVQLVIMPTHGYGVFRRFLLGSVTSKVLHDLSCPVLTGAHLTEQGGTGKIVPSNIVCAIDRSPESRDTLEWASRLAADFQAAFSVVHVIPHVDPSVTVSSDLKLQREATVRETIGAFQNAAAAKNMTVCIQEGEVADAVCGYAKSAGAHLVVIGRGKDRHMGRLRTNAYGIIRQSPCPVLSI
jgi:nucleotide-binding universal stress UspA family protein